MIQEDLVWFEYLSILPKRLATLTGEARLAGRQGVRVSITSVNNIPARDLEYFAPELRFVTPPEKPEVVVQNATPAYENYFRRTLGDTYWYFPWFRTNLRPDR
jgi:hypothetical protein